MTVWAYIARDPGDWIDGTPLGQPSCPHNTQQHHEHKPSNGNLHVDSLLSGLCSVCSLIIPGFDTSIVYSSLFSLKIKLSDAYIGSAPTTHTRKPQVGRTRSVASVAPARSVAAYGVTASTRRLPEGTGVAMDRHALLLGRTDGQRMPFRGFSQANLDLRRIRVRD